MTEYVAGLRERTIARAWRTVAWSRAPMLASAVVSITATQRRRFFWAAWWTGAPAESPFRKPDAANGGAESYEAALAEAERVAGRHLTPVEPYWARAWKVVLRGEPVPPRPLRRVAVAPPAAPRSSWEVLGLAPGASLEAVKQAFRQRARSTHPDHGGDAAEFLVVRRAYEKLVARITAR